VNCTVTSQVLPGGGLDPFFEAVTADCFGLAEGAGVAVRFGVVVAFGLGSGLITAPWIIPSGEMVWSQYEVTGPGQEGLVVSTITVVVHCPGPVCTRPGLGLVDVTLATGGEGDDDGEEVLLPPGPGELRTATTISGAAPHRFILNHPPAKFLIRRFPAPAPRSQATRAGEASAETRFVSSPMTRHASRRPQPRTLRCTQAYHRKGDQRKVVLRHADELPRKEERPK
jgi:hypothetical protein